MNRIAVVVQTVQYSTIVLYLQYQGFTITSVLKLAIQQRKARPTCPINSHKPELLVEDTNCVETSRARPERFPRLLS